MTKYNIIRVSAFVCTIIKKNFPTSRTVIRKEIYVITYIEARLITKRYNFCSEIALVLNLWEKSKNYPYSDKLIENPGSCIKMIILNLHAKIKHNLSNTKKLIRG